MRLLLVHCWGGDGRSCWSGWLADKLRAEGIEVLAPDLPDTNNPDLNKWLAELRKQVKNFDPKDDWILVGHSLGCSAILKLLETFGKGERIKAAILVAAFAKELGIREIKNFVDQDFDWQRIKKKCKRFIVINSDNDPYIELSEGKRIAKLLGAKFIVEHNAGHINEGSGFTKYERLLKIIEKIDG